MNKDYLASHIAMKMRDDDKSTYVFISLKNKSNRWHKKIL